MVRKYTNSIKLLASLSRGIKMKNLYILRGCPASGKSTWIKQNNLERYVISSDQLRLLFPFDLDENGDFIITQMFDTEVWKLLFNLLEYRMKLGQPVIIDATHYKGSFISNYKQLCQKYNYLIKVVDFTEVEYDELVKRNSQRPALQVVPEEVIKRMYDTIQANDKDLRKQYNFIDKDTAVKEIFKDKQTYLGPVIRKIDYDNIGDLIFRSLNRQKEQPTLYKVVFDNFQKLIPEFEMIRDYDQNNKYHYLTLDLHSWEVCKYLYPGDTYLYFAGLLHDIGKPLVAFKGKDNYTHFYNHADMGAQLFQMKIASRLLKGGISKNEVDKIHYLIKHHDDNISETFIEDKLKEGIDIDLIHDLLLLEYADGKAHIQDDKIQNRISVCEKMLNKIDILDYKKV